MMMGGGRKDTFLVKSGKWSDDFLCLREKVLKKDGEIFKFHLTRAVYCGILCLDGT